MVKTILKIIKSTYSNVLQSIAFYPVLTSVLFLITALMALSFDNSELAQQVQKKVPHLFIQDYETARSILSTLLGGILSLTVFSFTMVMVVLSQASSDFSPRLLPGLISNKKHQIILGIYIGTLLYCTIILISLGAYGMDSNTLGLSSMLAAIFGVLCIALFVYFIHNISRAIQIHNIIDRIYNRCNTHLSSDLITSTTEKIALQHIGTANWKVLVSDKSGYFRGFDGDLMSGTLKENENQVEVLPYLNQHIWKGDAILHLKKELSKKDIENLIFCMNISSDRHEDDKGIGGMIKLMEIAVKAMSPGINDPGTAIAAITKLGSLLSKFLQYPQFTSEPFADEKWIIIKNNVSAEELMRLVVQPIRLYSKNDSSVMYELIGALLFILRAPNILTINKEVVKTELQAVRTDIEKNIDNDIDKQRILKLFENPGYE